MHVYLSFGTGDKLDFTYHDGDEATEPWVTIDMPDYSGGVSVTMTRSQFDDLVVRGASGLQAGKFVQRVREPKVGDVVEMHHALGYDEATFMPRNAQITGIITGNNDHVHYLVQCGITKYTCNRDDFVLAERRRSEFPKAIRNGQDVLEGAREIADGAR